MATLFMIDLVVSFLHGLIVGPLVGPVSLSVECYLLPERKFLKIFETISSCGFSRLVFKIFRVNVQKKNAATLSNL